MIKWHKILNVSLLLLIGLNLALLIYKIFSFQYPHILDWGYFISLLILCVLPTTFSAVYIAFSRFFKKWMKIVSAVLIIISIPISAVYMVSWGISSPIGSQTDDIDNYLKLDRYVEDNASVDIFPEKLPESAENARYFYRYRHMTEADYDIYLKVNLSDSEFNEEKSRIKSAYPDAEIVKADNETEEYRILYSHDRSYSYEFVSFSESDLSVTYNVSYSLEGDTVGDVPYFKELEQTA